MEGADTDAVRLGNKQLGTIDCVAQSLAVGPVFSAVLLGGILFSLSGGVSPFVIVITFVGMLGIGWTVSEFAKRYSGSGTVYEFIAHSLGRRAAVLAAGAYYFAVLALSGVGIPIVGGLLLRDFARSHWSINWPWIVWALILIAVIFTINTIGVQVSVKTQLVVIMLSLIPLVILFFAVVFDGSVSNSLHSLNPGNVSAGGSVFKGLLFAILMYVGFELAAALGEETANPRRSIPRAVLATLGIVTVVYFATQYLLAVGATESATDFIPMAQLYVGRWLSIWIEIALILDVIAVGIGFCLAGARGVFTLGRDGLLPKWFGGVSRNEQPQSGNITVSAVGIVCVFIVLAKYGSDAVVGEDGAPVTALAEGAMQAFLICSTIGGFIISAIYALLCLGALRSQARRPVDIAAALVGLAIAVLGVAAQFIDGTAPVGDAKWGLWIGLVVLGVCAVWAAAAPRRSVDNVARHTVHHGHEVRHPV